MGGVGGGGGGLADGGGGGVSTCWACANMQICPKGIYHQSL